MNEILHVSSQFDEDLSRLRTHVLQMGGLVENQVSAVIDAYASGDPAGVGQILETDRKINALEKTIDDDCAQIIARRQPTASDLRLVFGVTKIVTDLERAGDVAGAEARRSVEADEALVERVLQRQDDARGAEAVAVDDLHAAGDRDRRILVREEDHSARLRSGRDLRLAGIQVHARAAHAPDAIEFVDAIPHGATGKISKKDLRDQFRDYKLEDA